MRRQMAPTSLGRTLHTCAGWLVQPALPGLAVGMNAAPGLADTPEREALEAAVMPTSARTGKTRGYLHHQCRKFLRHAEEGGMVAVERQYGVARRRG
jgi:hypothetical protein